MIASAEELKEMSSKDKYFLAISYYRQGYTIENAAKLAKVSKQTLKRKLNVIDRVRFEVLGHV